MSNLDPDYVRGSIQRLAEMGSKVFGSLGHGFALAEPLSDAAVESFEQRHRIRLPADYRHFMTRIANGGAGPDYGVFPLGVMDDLAELKPWAEGDGFVGTLSEPFRFQEVWNDTYGMPDFDQLGDQEEEYENQMTAFEVKYWAPTLMNGAFPICHHGCALRYWLVVTGSEAGHVWFDQRADYKGLSPVLLKDGSRATFSAWYSEWLEEALSRE